MRRWLSGWLASVALVAAVSGVIELLRSDAPVLSLSVLYLLAVLPVAIVWGMWFAVVAAVLSTVAFAGLFLPPPYSARFGDSPELAALAVFLVTAVVVGELAARSQRQARASARLTEEQAALRRIATLVARSVSQSEVFEAVTREVGLLSGADLARMERYEADGTVTGVAGWSRVHDKLAVGTRFALEGVSIAIQVRDSVRPVRVDSFADASGPIAAEAVALGIRSSVGCPIVVRGQLWGVIAASSKREAPFPADTESQMGDFTELVATAIANAEDRTALNQLAEEQAALHRVATLVARGVPPTEVFAAVTDEVVRLLDLDMTSLLRFEPDGMATFLAVHGIRSEVLQAGSTWKPTPDGAFAAVLRTGNPSRVDDFNLLSGSLAEEARNEDVRSSVACPIRVEGRIWGAFGVASRQGPLPPDTEQRLVDFTELVGTAIANAESRAELAASRARVVAAADETRRRIERDLHDGTQQRLVSLGLDLRLVRSGVPPNAPELETGLDRVADELNGVVEDLREISRGIHPAILAEGGLGPALRTLARRSAVPVQLDVLAHGRLPQSVEVAAYYVISEALTNTVKHAGASVVRVVVEERDDGLHLSIRDDGVGGADPKRGSGLIGLGDRVASIGGSIDIKSYPGEGTLIVVKLPVQR